MNNQSQNVIDLVLAESLKELAVAKPIEKITIKEITDKAGVIRPTFYNHFQDKYELLEWITVNELFTPIKPLLVEGKHKEAVEYILTVMLNEKDFYRRATQLTGQNSFSEIFTRCVGEAVAQHMDIKSLAGIADYQWLKEEAVAEFLANAISWVTFRWIKNGMIVPIDELTDIYIRIFHSPIIEVVTKAQNK